MILKIIVGIIYGDITIYKKAFVNEEEAEVYCEVLNDEVKDEPDCWWYLEEVAAAGLLRDDTNLAEICHDLPSSALNQIINFAREVRVEYLFRPEPSPEKSAKIVTTKASSSQFLDNPVGQPCQYNCGKLEKDCWETCKHD